MSRPVLPESVVGFIADHIPPNHFNPPGGPQLFFPQCPTCSSKQSLAVKTRRRTLVAPHWARLTWSDLWLPSPLLLLPFWPVLSHLLALME